MQNRIIITLPDGEGYGATELKNPLPGWGGLGWGEDIAFLVKLLAYKNHLNIVLRKITFTIKIFTEM